MTCFCGWAASSCILWYNGRERSNDMATLAMFAGSASFPKDQQYMVQAWIVKHEAELYANWELLHAENATFFKIEG